VTKQYVVTADIGTQGTKTALIDEEGCVAASAFHPSRLIRRPGGQVEQDPDEMLASVVHGIRDMLRQSSISPGSIAAIGLDGQMAGILGIDKEWQAVTPYDSWLDRRCEAYMPEMKAWGEDAIIRLTGCPVTYAHGPKVLWWKSEHPDVYKRIAKFVVPSAYVAGKLAGLTADRAFIDYTHLHFAGFADTASLRWSDTLLDAFSVDRERMPDIVSPWDRIGGLTANFARETGVPAGTPIVAGCGDTAAATLGAGIVSPGQLFDVAGTASVLSCCVDVYAPDVPNRMLLYARSVLPGLWTPLAYINGGGQCLAWFRDQFGGPGTTFDDLNRLAEEVAAGCNGLLFIPHFGGSVCPNDPDIRGSWLGLDWSHGAGAMYRAIMEAIAYEYCRYKQTLSELAGGTRYTKVRAVGGGARSAFFNAVKADALGIPYETLRVSDTALLAGAAIAGYGVGLHADLAGTAARFAVPDAEFRPDAGRHEQYRAQAGRYRIALDGMSKLYGNLK